MNDDPKYVRVYYSIRSDGRFEDVYGSDRLLASWLRLLLDADAVWPEPASLPATANRPAVRDLVKVGLVELAPNGCFRIHGLDAERRRRMAEGKLGGLARAERADRDASGRFQPVVPADRQPDQPATIQPDKPADASPSSEQSIDEQRLAKTSNATQVVVDAADAFWKLTGIYPNQNAREWIDRLAREYGTHDRVSKAMGEEWIISQDRRTFMSRTETRLERTERAADRAEREDEVRRNAAKREPLAPLRLPDGPLTDEEKAELLAEYAAEKAALAAEGES